MADPKRLFDPKHRPKIIQRKNAPSSKRASKLSNVSVREKKPSDAPPGLVAFTLLVLYKNMYLIGIAVLRKLLRYRRRLKLFAVRLRNKLRGLGHWAHLAAARRVQRITAYLRAPFDRIATTRRELTPLIREKKKQGEPTLALRVERILPVARLVAKVITTICNYVLPVAALCVLVVVIQNQIRTPWGLMVTYEGVELGYVENEADYEEALLEVRNRMISGASSDASSYLAGDIRFDLQPVEEDWLITSDELANNIIQAHGGEIEEAYGLYINDEFYGAVAESATLLEEMEKLKWQGVVDVPGAVPDFEKSIRFNPGLYPQESIVSVESLSALIHSHEAYDEYYIVEDGDTPTGIADKVGIAYARLREMNPWIDSGNIRAGDEILTAVARPFLSVKSTYTEVYEEEYDYEIIENQNSTYAVGYRDVTQEGKKGRRLVAAEVTAINGLVTNSQMIDSFIIREAVPERVTVGINNPRDTGSTSGGTGSSGPGASSTTAPPSGASNTGGFIWPTRGGYVSARLYGYPGHTGMDIAGPGYGAPIYASASGRVITSKRTWVGYGHYIVIDHGNGYQTLYAHNSDLYVNVGDYVDQGQVIAAMGSTGNSSGNHVHFEVRYNGRVLNPADFVGG